MVGKVKGKRATGGKKNTRVAPTAGLECGLEGGQSLGGEAGGFGRVRDGDAKIVAFFTGNKVKKNTAAGYAPELEAYRSWIAAEFKSDDVYLESAEDDEVRARVWVQYGIHLFMVRGLRDKEISGALGAVKHYFEIALKGTAFLANTLVATLMKSTGRTTAEKRMHAMERAEHAIYPLCDEIIEELKKLLWEGTAWDDFRGAHQRMAYAAILLAIRRGFRVSNYVKVQPGGEDHCIRAADVIFEVQSAEEGGVTRRVLAHAMRGEDVARVRGFTTKVYTTKTGETVPTLVSQYTDRSTAEDSHLVDVLTECVQRTGLKEGDELFTVYRKYSYTRKGARKATQRETRRVLQRKDVAGFIKDGSEAVGLSRKNFSTHSLRKTHATATTGGEAGSALAGDLNWAEPGGRRSNSTRSGHYDFSGAVGAGARGRSNRVTKAQLVSLMPAKGK